MGQSRTCSDPSLTASREPAHFAAGSHEWGLARRLWFRLTDQRALEADLRRLFREDRGKPARIRNECRWKGIAAGLHFLPRTGLAIFDALVGDERQRQRRPLRHILAPSFSTASFSASPPE